MCPNSRFLRIWSRLLKKSLMENFIFRSLFTELVVKPDILPYSFTFENVSHWGSWFLSSCYYQHEQSLEKI